MSQEIAPHIPFSNQTAVFEGKQELAWQYLLDDTTSELFYGGGVGSGKSVVGCCFEIYMRTKYPRTHGFIGRNEYSQLEKSTMLRFFELMRSFGYREGRDYHYNDQKHRVLWRNGSLTFFNDLQYRPRDKDFHRLGSTEYTNAFIDEAPEVMPEAKEAIRERIRYRTAELGIQPKLLLTGNPGDHWIKTQYVFDQEDLPVVLPEHKKVVLATLEDNPDKAFVAQYRKWMEQGTDEYRKRRMLYGDWLARAKTGTEFLSTFDLKYHSGKFEYQPDLPLHITWDFNLYPFITCLVAQIQPVPGTNAYEVYFLKEYCLSYPDNGVLQVCDRILDDIRAGYFYGHNAGMFIYGDYNGNTNNNLGIVDIRNNYQLINTKLKRHLSNTSNRVIPNPLQSIAKQFMRSIFMGHQPVSVFFDQRMTHTIRDCINLKEGPDGGLLKERIKDSKLGISYEKYGHCVQAAYYLVISAFKQIYDSYSTRV